MPEYKIWYEAPLAVNMSDVNKANWLKSRLKMPDTDKLKEFRRTELKHATHIQYKQYFNNTELLFSGINLHIYKDGSMLIQAYLTDTKNKVAIGDASLPYLFPAANGFIYVDRIADSKQTHWEFRNEDGRLIHTEDRYLNYKDTSIKAKVFMVNPVNSAGVPYHQPFFADNSDLNNDSLEAQLQVVEMKARYYNDSFFLEHPLFSFKEISGPYLNDRYGQTSDSFFYNRSDTRFEAVNVMYHLQKFNEYLNYLGYDTLVKPIEIDVHGLGGDDNSRFDPDLYQLEYGDGNVDDAEDGEVVIHEFIHQVSTTANYTSGNGNERKAMEEGNCDYFAKSYSRSLNDNNSYKVFSWDGHNEFWPGYVINSTDHYPEDLEPGYNANRDIWSSTLMCIHDYIGRETTDSLALEQFFYQYPSAKMPDMAAILLHIDSVLFAGRNYSAIKECLVVRGFIEYGVDIPKVELPSDFKLRNSFAFSQGEAALSLSSANTFKLDVLNTMGQTIFTAVDLKEFELSPNHLAKGMYILRIQQAGNTYIRKVMR